MATSFTAENVFQLVVYLAIFVGILFLTYYITRWIAGNQKQLISGRNFEVIETSKVSTNKYLQIIRIGKEDYYIIGVGKDEITLIGKLDANDVIISSETKTKGSDFLEVLNKFKNNNKSD